MGTQEGGGDSPCVTRFFTRSTPSDADSTSTPIARPNGTMKIASMTIVSSAVATDLRPPAQRSALSSSGHVAMTMVVAQISAPRNGNSVQRLPAINSAMMRITRKIRVRSGRATCCMLCPLYMRASSQVLWARADQPCDRHEDEHPAATPVDIAFARASRLHLGSAAKLPPSARCRFTRCTRCSLCTRSRVILVISGMPAAAAGPIAGHPVRSGSASATSSQRALCVGRGRRENRFALPQRELAGQAFSTSPNAFSAVCT